jgi:hypothetical protein
VTSLDPTVVSSTSIPLPPFTTFSLTDTAIGVIADDDRVPVASFSAVAPDPRETPVATVRFEFDSPVTGVDVSDFTLTRNGVPVPFDPTVSVHRWPVPVVELWELRGLGTLTAQPGAYRLTLRAAGSGILGGKPLAADAVEEWTMAPHVIRRFTFYNGSAFDVGVAAQAGKETLDDRAIATDKQALLPGQKASFANYTTYSKGLNGIMIDVDGLPKDGKISPKDFIFRAGNGGDPTHWKEAPAPASIDVRSGAGAGNADRIVITWGDNAVRGQWLQVSILPTSATGLVKPDVFYFGNLPGDLGDAFAGGASVNALDALRVRRALSQQAPITSRFDFNRDGKVTAQDYGIARSAQRRSLSLFIAPLITLPPPTATPEAAGSDQNDRELFA